VTRRLLAVAGAAVTAAACFVAAAAAQSEPTLVELGGARFPDRAYVLTLPNGVEVAPGQVEVQENGKAVTGLVITPAGAARRSFGVVLAIDTSRSMRGAPLEGAIAAARAFADHLNANQKVGVLLFDRDVETLLPLTSDGAAIERSLATSPATQLGTHLYDGVSSALDLLSSAKIDSGAVVVLSDGADTGSLVLPAGVGARASAAHARIFTVGLRSRFFDGKALRDLAALGGGDYSEASSPADLEAIYASLGSQLANEYVIRYRSLSGAGERVNVAVRAEGIQGTAVSGYLAPALEVKEAPPYHPSFGYRFWRSATAALAVSLAAALLLGAALAVVLRPRNRSLRDRMSEFVSIYVPERRKDSSPLPEKVFLGAERSFARTPWWAKFKQEVALAGLRMAPVQLALWTLVATVGALLLLKVIFGTVLVAAGALVIPFVVREFVRRRVDRVRNRFAEQLADNLQVLASALRAGHSLVGALSVVVDDAPEPSRSEFRRVVADEQLGVPLDQSLTVVAQRMESKDLEQVALVATLQRDTGGNTAEVLDRVTETVRARFELRRMVRTLTAQGRMSRWVVSFLPVGLFAIITLINPNYMRPLFTHTSGRVLLVLSAVMVIAGSLIIRKIVNVKV
jgi:tight adherence protein B